LRGWIADFDRRKLSSEEVDLVEFADATIRRRWAPGAFPTEPGVWS
jgi:hypothetical protein